MKEFALKELFPLIEEGIEKNGSYRFFPNGTSMLPLIRQKTDSVVLTAAREIKKYDIVLYTRADQSFVLHRVVEVTEDGFNLCGDNQTDIEKGIKREQIKAVVSGIYKEEQYIPITDKEYLKYSKSRVSSIKWRRLICGLKAYLRNIFIKKSA